jgi:hypothetical protein
VERGPANELGLGNGNELRRERRSCKQRGRRHDLAPVPSLPHRHPLAGDAQTRTPESPHGQGRQ